MKRIISLAMAALMVCGIANAQTTKETIKERKQIARLAQSELNAKASKAEKERFSKLCDDYFRSGRKISLVLNLIDIRHKPSENDKAMIEFLNNAGIPYFVVFTKCDKMSKMQVSKQIKMMAEEFDFAPDAAVFAVSSDKKAGIRELCDAITDFVFLT